MVEREFDRARRATMVFGEVGKAGHRTENVVGEGTSEQKGSDL